MSKRESNKYSKGDEIRFFNGQYEGRMGWLNSSKSVSGNRIPVIVDMGGGKEKATSVSVWSCSKHHPPNPTNFMEAVFMQKPSVEKLAKKLAKELSILGATKKKSRMESIVKRIDEEILEADRIRMEIGENSIKYED
jgi:hypothetical protein